MQDSASLFTSPMFTVSASPNQIKYLVHGGILSKSCHFKVQVDGSWKDIGDGKIELRQDEESVGRMVQWLYGGNYSFPLPQKGFSGQVELADNEQDDKALEEDNEEPDTTLEEHLEMIVEKMDPDNASPIKDLTTKIFQRAAWDDTDWEPLLPETPLVLSMWLAEDGRHSRSLNFNDLLVAHTDVWNLGDYTDLPGLQACAFQHLRESLQAIGGLTGGAMTSSTLYFIRDIYKTTNESPTKRHPIRKLLTEFILSSLSDLEDKHEFRTFLMECEDFARDIWLRLRDLVPFYKALDRKRHDEGIKPDGTEYREYEEPLAPGEGLW